MTRPFAPICGYRIIPCDLKFGRDVVIARESSPFLLVMTVALVTRDWIVCHGLDVGISLAIRRCPGGRLEDDSGLEIAVYQYVERRAA